MVTHQSSKLITLQQLCVTVLIYSKSFIYVLSGHYVLSLKQMLLFNMSPSLASYMWTSRTMAEHHGNHLQSQHSRGWGKKITTSWTVAQATQRLKASLDYVKRSCFKNKHAYLLNYKFNCFKILTITNMIYHYCNTSLLQIYIAAMTNTS